MKRKNRKVQRVRVREDIISGLPEDVLIHILSDLETIDAVRTCILSSRWKNLWKKVYKLNFNFPKERYGRCSKFINQVVDRIEYGNIQSFRLYARFSPRRDSSIGESSYYIDDFLPDWTAYAARHNVRELTLDVDCNSFLFPKCFLTCASLVKLSLKTRCFGFDISESTACFPSLKSLYIFVDQDHDVSQVRNLFRGCPVLEDLTISTEVDQDDVMTFELNMPSLRTLTIEESNVHFAEYGAQNKYVVEAHNLECLEISANETFPYFVLAEAPYLRKVSLCTWISNNAEYMYTIEADKAVELLHAIKHTRCLSLMTGAVGILSMAVDGNMPMFPNLIDLELAMESFDHIVHDSEVGSGWYDFPKLIGHFLRNSPILEALTLELGLPYFHVYKDPLSYEAVEPIEVAWFDLSDFLPSSLSFLKRIQVKSVGEVHDLKPIKLLLEHCTNLESFSVGLYGSVSKIKMFRNRILKFPRSSTLGEIEFTYDFVHDEDEDEDVNV